ncbi:MAG: glycosyltransferase family 4 protein [Saprospiraceae bacterium]|nr:glycosyltransferase family 4 protein [Saprospiraceae bacterium]
MKQQTQTSPRTPVHYVVWRSEPGGAELSVNHYIRHFSPRREVYVYSLRAAENELYDASKIHFQNGADKDWECYKRYFRYCRAHRGHVFHLMSTGPIILLITLLAGLRLPVYHIHGTIYWKKPLKKLYLKTAWWLASWFRIHFVANSKYSAGIFRRVVLPVEPKVIYNGFDVDHFWRQRSQRQHPKRLAYAGRLQPGKNVDLVLRLFEDVAGQYPELELHIAGEGALRPALEQQARDSQFGARIHFHGWVRDVAAFYGSVDLFLFLSAYESFGNVLSEALLTGLPVLTSPVPVFEEIHGGEKAFLLGQPEQYAELRDNLNQALLQFPSLAQKAFDLGEQLKPVFDIDNHLIEIERIYEQIESTRHLLPLRSAEAV